MFKVKPIKPKADYLSVSAIERAVRETMQDVAKDAKGDFEQTVTHWGHEVRFEAIADKSGFVIGTDDEVYQYVDSGTEAHDIRPRNAKYLRFATGGQAKTKPRVIGSGPGRSGSGAVYARRVRHPGTKAREFSETIKKKYEREVPLRIGQALGDVLRRGGD